MSDESDATAVSFGAGDSASGVVFVTSGVVSESALGDGVVVGSVSVGGVAVESVSVGSTGGVAVGSVGGFLFFFFLLKSLSTIYGPTFYPNSFREVGSPACCKS